MVIHDLDVEGVAVEPAKAQAPLVVDSNAELSHPVAGESFQPIPRRSAKICEVDRCIELSQATQRGALQLRTQTSDREPFEQPPRIPIAKAANHWRIVTRRVIADKRHPVQEADGARYAARGAGTSPFCPVAGPKSASTIHEAVQLVLQAGALGEGSELFVLDMGEPIKIVDLARDLIRLSGLDEGTDIEIEFTGIRPGEKLYEEVFFGHEDVRSTHHPKVLRTISTEPDARTGESRGRVLSRLPRTRDNQGEGLVRGEGRRCWVLGLGDGIGEGEGWPSPGRRPALYSRSPQ